MLKKIDFANKIDIFDTDNDFKNYNKNFKNKSQIDFLSISDGCNWNCSYCNIKKIKGSTKSKSIPNILQEIEAKYNK
jgi:tRNA A37 methylthiotransferase MiaB